DVDQEIIKKLNPAYKRGIVNGTREFPKRLVLPEVKPSAYGALYAVLSGTAETPMLMNASTGGRDDVDLKAVTHRVRQGETLDQIARKYRVTVQDLRVWNNLKKNLIVPGQRLKISTPQAPAANTKAERDATFISYRVKRGDTLSGIAENHRGATISAIKAANGLKSSRNKPGMTLKIQVN